MSERIWEQFLSASDRSDVQQNPAPVFGMGERPALILVDLYRKAFGIGSGSEHQAVAQGSCGQSAWDALPYLQELLTLCRSAGIPIIHITGVTEHPRWSDPVRVESAGSRTRVGSPERRIDYEIIPELSPIEGEYVVTKAGPSAFWGTSVPALLTRHQVDSVIVAGESTSGCVRATVVDARSFQFRVTVIEECVFDRHEAAHAINLFDMDRKYADVIPLNDLRTELAPLVRDVE